MKKVLYSLCLLLLAGQVHAQACKKGQPVNMWGELEVAEHSHEFFAQGWFHKGAFCLPAEAIQITQQLENASAKQLAFVTNQQALQFQLSEQGVIADGGVQVFLLPKQLTVSGKDVSPSCLAADYQVESVVSTDESSALAFTMKNKQAVLAECANAAFTIDEVASLTLVVFSLPEVEEPSSLPSMEELWQDFTEPSDVDDATQRRLKKKK